MTRRTHPLSEEAAYDDFIRADGRCRIGTPIEIAPKPGKETEVQLRQMGCPYGVSDERTLVWLDGYAKGQEHGMNAGAKIVSDVYDAALAGAVG